MADWSSSADAGEDEPSDQDWETFTRDAEAASRPPDDGRKALIDYLVASPGRSRSFLLGLVAMHWVVITASLAVILDIQGAAGTVLLLSAIPMVILGTRIPVIYRGAPHPAKNYFVELWAIFGMRLVVTLAERHGIPSWVVYALRLAAVAAFVLSVAV